LKPFFNVKNIYVQYILRSLEIPYQLDPPIPHFTSANVHAAILQLHPRKSPGYDLITGKVLKELSESYSSPTSSTLSSVSPTSLPNGKLRTLSFSSSPENPPTPSPPLGQSSSFPFYLRSSRNSSSLVSFL
jgi:hypothetical protein